MATNNEKVPKTLAVLRGRAIKKQNTDLDNVRSFSAEGKDFKGLNKTIKVPFPKPKVMPMTQTTFPGSTPDNGKLKESYTVTHAEILMQKKGNKDEDDSDDKPKKKLSDLRKKTDEAYVAPNVGNNNYAQNLPAPIGSKPKVDKRLTIPKKEANADYNRDAGYVAHEDVIMSIDDLSSIFEAHVSDPCWKGYKQYGEKTKNGKKVPNCVPVKEELKVGEGKDEVDGNNEAKKVRGTNAKGPGTGKVGVVKRKYLGNSRGRTATGQKAHAIDVEPVIGAKDKNWNKTTPSGEPKRK